MDVDFIITYIEQVSFLAAPLSEIQLDSSKRSFWSVSGVDCATTQFPITFDGWRRPDTGQTLIRFCTPAEGWFSRRVTWPILWQSRNTPCLREGFTSLSYWGRILYAKSLVMFLFTGSVQWLEVSVLMIIPNNSSSATDSKWCLIALHLQGRFLFICETGRPSASCLMNFTF